MIRITLWAVMFAIVLSMTNKTIAAEPTLPLTKQLTKETSANLAKAPREYGDASRGAIVFYRQGHGLRVKTHPNYCEPLDSVKGLVLRCAMHG